MLIFGDARLVPGADIAASLPAEKQRVDELRASGFIEQLFSRVDGTGALLIIEAPSLAEATAVLATLPFVEQGLMTIPVVPIARL